MAEELVKFLSRIEIRCRYIHSDIDTLERVEIMQGLRKGLFDVLVGVNLLREGLDLPEVSLVIILDADKEGFLRSHRSLTQTIGRAARNINGRAIMYANRVTKSMQKTIDETNYRRRKQDQYNKKNNITPTPLNKSIKDVFQKEENQINIKKENNISKEIKNLSKSQKEKEIRRYRAKMEKAAKSLDFIEAARLRDIIKILKEYWREDLHLPLFYFCTLIVFFSVFWNSFLLGSTTERIPFLYVEFILFISIENGNSKDFWKEEDSNSLIL